MSEGYTGNAYEPAGIVHGAEILLGPWRLRHHRDHWDLYHEEYDPISCSEEEFEQLRSILEIMRK